jgi:hypothetical protein
MTFSASKITCLAISRLIQLTTSAHFIPGYLQPLATTGLFYNFHDHRKIFSGDAGDDDEGRN